MLEVAGVTVIAVSVAAGAAGVMLSVALPETAPDVAVMVADPATTAVARPPVEMVATDVADELQVTDEVISLVVLLE